MRNVKYIMTAVVIASSIRSLAMIEDLKTAKNILHEFRNNTENFLNPNNRNSLKYHSNKFEQVVNKLQTLRTKLIQKFKHSQQRKYFIMLKLIDIIYKFARKLYDTLNNRPYFFIVFIKRLKNITDEIINPRTLYCIERRINNLETVLDKEEELEFNKIKEIVTDIINSFPKKKIQLLKTMRNIWNR